MGGAAAEELDLSIIVVSYNTRRMTLDCLRSVREQTRRTRYELIVLDNASSDGSADAIATEEPGVILIRSTDNLGFGRANNRAARQARGRHLLLLNPDTVILDGAVDRLMDFARARPEARMWGGRTVFADGSVNRTSCARQIGVWSLFCRFLGLSMLFPRSPVFNGQFYGRWDCDSEREVEVITGCFLLLPTALWNALGGFDEAFVMYAEEADLCLRARQLGARPRVTPTAEIIHHGGASDTVRAEKLVKLLNGTIALIEKHWTWPARPTGKALVRGMVLTRHMAATTARILGRELRQGAWSEVWRRRAEWRQGYPLTRSSTM